MNPLMRVSRWWDGVLERYDSKPRVLKIGISAAIALFFYALPLLRPPVITTNSIDFGGVMFSVVAFSLVALFLVGVISRAYRAKSSPSVVFSARRVSATQPERSASRARKPF